MQPACCIASSLVEVLAVRDVGALAPQEDGADRSNGRDHAEGGAEAKAASRGGGIFGLCLHPQEAEERLDVFDRRQEAARAADQLARGDNDKGRGLGVHTRRLRSPETGHAGGSRAGREPGSAPRSTCSGPRRRCRTHTPGRRTCGKRRRSRTPGWSRLPWARIGRRRRRRTCRLRSGKGRARARATATATARRRATAMATATDRRSACTRTWTGRPRTAGICRRGSRCPGSGGRSRSTCRTGAGGKARHSRGRWLWPDCWWGPCSCSREGWSQPDRKARRSWTCSTRSGRSAQPLRKDRTKPCTPARRRRSPRRGGSRWRSRDRTGRQGQGTT